MRPSLESLPELVIDVDTTDCMPPPAGNVATMPSPASVANPPSYEDWRALYQNFCELGPTAREVLMMTAKRLAIGRKLYNDDFEADRDMAHEALEEAADLAVYCQVGLIKARRL